MKLKGYLNSRVNESERVQPKNKVELLKIIEETIASEGPKCDLNFIDVSKITDMSRLFCGSKFNGDISKWDVSNVENMENMFNSSKFNGDISKWDVSNVKSMGGMFRDAGRKYSLKDIEDWEINNKLVEYFKNSAFLEDMFF